MKCAMEPDDSKTGGKNEKNNGQFSQNICSGCIDYCGVDHFCISIICRSQKQ